MQHCGSYIFFFVPSSLCIGFSLLSVAHDDVIATKSASVDLKGLID